MCVYKELVLQYNKVLLYDITVFIEKKIQVRNNELIYNSVKLNEFHDNPSSNIPTITAIN